MIIGFLTGIIVDIFSDTPGIHASASVLVMFLRNLWLSIVNDDWQEITNLNIIGLRKSVFAFFIFPLVFIQHNVIFVVENGVFHLFGMVISKIFFSAIFSSFVIFIINYLLASRKRRA